MVLSIELNSKLTYDLSTSSFNPHRLHYESFSFTPPLRHYNLISLISTHIGKFYVGPIQMADLRSRLSTRIHLWLLLIHLWVLSIHLWVFFLASVRLWSYSEPNCGSMILFRAGLWINDSVQSRTVDRWVHWVWSHLWLSARLDLKSPKCYSIVTLISRCVCLRMLKCTSWNRSSLWHSAKSVVTPSYFEI